MTRSTEPRSFFKSDELHHCTHAGVERAKRCSVDRSNRLVCGPRSARDGGAFCEIGRFESHLCCRACAYEGVCSRSRLLVLPCTGVDGSADPTFFDGSVDRCAGVRQQPAQSPKG